MDRRRFLHQIGRGTILSALAIFSGTMIYRNLNSERETCDFDFVCRNCKKVKTCALPDGIDFKKKNSIQ
ncbi:hypothetical protein EO244_13880 [Ancylomarina salipaludis]|uniref:Uncharacterized protein n=1 Tax=Ancylomarina salipaludis TaxID=2501299 RepID=A0A4Q1JK53_9BACT|nr:hypothetical protein [Ancylomarina salipaludis]RXQ89868.1 hypothetical protein EO244_13880 [Ancylomarina salipaludis]